MFVVLVGHLVAGMWMVQAVPLRIYYSERSVLWWWLRWWCDVVCW